MEVSLNDSKQKLRVHEISLTPKIIHELILEKFKDVLEEHHRRRMKRQTSRISAHSKADETVLEENFVSHTFDNDTERRSEEFELVTDSKKENKIQPDNVTVEYDPRAFLQLALGDLANLNTSSTENGSVLGTPIMDDYSRSIGTSDISCLISKTNTTFNSTNMASSNFLCSTSVETLNIEENITTLMREAAVQYQIMSQAANAVELCNRSSEFVGGMAHLEAERLLLLATCTREDIFREIRHIDTMGVDRNDIVGKVSISNLQILRINDNPLEYNSKHYNRFFVCILGCLGKTFATEAWMKDNEGTVDLRGTYLFDKLPMHFEISVTLYSLILLKNEHIGSKCPRLLKLCKRRRRRNRLHTINGSTPMKSTSFKPWGEISVCCANLNETKFRVFNGVGSTKFFADVKMVMSHTVEFLTKHEGFLNVGKENRGPIIWNRYWCVLSDAAFYCWAYKSQQENDSPIHQLDLKLCATSEISRTTRSQCVRSKTLLIIMFCCENWKRCSQHTTYTKYFLNADNYEDMRMWERKLNDAVLALRNWKMISF